MASYISFDPAKDFGDGYVGADMGIFLIPSLVLDLLFLVMIEGPTLWKFLERLKFVICWSLLLKLLCVLSGYTFNRP